MRRVALAALALAAAAAPALAARGDLVTVGSGTLGSAQRQSAITPNGATVVWIDAGKVAHVRTIGGGEAAPFGTGVEEVSVSADGARVAYRQTGGTAGVYLRDVAAGTSTLVQSGASQPAISADGSTVAYVHDPGALEEPQVFARTASGTRRVSEAANGQGGNGASSRPALSADGRVVAFSSAATNLSADDDNGQTDVFAREGTNPVEPLSRGGDGPSLAGGISEDGSRVTFQTTAQNLGTGDDVVVYDRPTAKLTGVAPDGATAPAISPDGRFVAFRLGGEVRLRDTASTTVIPAGTGDRPSVSRAGRFVVLDNGSQVLRRETREPPAIVARPAISGTAQEGETLQCSTGTWSGGPTGYAYAWLVDGLGAGSGPSYVVQTADVGRDLRCRVTATNQDDSTSEISDGVRPIARPEQPFVAPDTPPQSTPAPITEPPAPELSLRVSPKRDKRAPHRFTVRGTVSPAAGCEQPVTVTVTKGTKRVGRKRAAPAGDCAFRLVFTFTRKQLGRRGTLRVAVAFPGAETVRTSVRFG